MKKTSTDVKSVFIVALNCLEFRDPYGLIRNWKLCQSTLLKMALQKGTTHKQAVNKTEATVPVLDINN
ncbi:hypothetical protein GCM10022218_27870 [Sphingobacterium ginsenosidimutans]|uniref:Uncharacterized protein n=1 Tax=Sphingobacterium ginsenosidimutans TaxID=687845 RepID=A0ABP8A513_9SPHI